MKKYLVSLACMFVIACGVMQLVPPAQSQSGGFPSLPTFQGVNIGAATASGFAPVIPGTVQVASASQPGYWFQDNSQASGSRAVSLTYTGGGLMYESCPDSGSGCAFVQLTEICAFKTAQQTLASSTTLTADNALSLSFLRAGNYRITGYVQFVDHTTGTQGFKFSFVASALSVTGAYSYDGIVNTSNANSTAGTMSATIGGYGSVQALATVDSDANGNFTGDALRFSGGLNVNAAGTLTFQWAQNSSSANYTAVNQGSWFCAKQIS